jgi:hypothetical protein
MAVSDAIYFDARYTRTVAQERASIFNRHGCLRGEKFRRGGRSVACFRQAHDGGPSFAQPSRSPRRH